MTAANLFTLAVAPLTKRLRMFWLRYRIEWLRRDRLMLLREADLARLHANLRERQFIVLQADLNLLERDHG